MQHFRSSSSALPLLRLCHRLRILQKSPSSTSKRLATSFFCLLFWRFFLLFLLFLVFPIFLFFFLFILFLVFLFWLRRRSVGLHSLLVCSHFDLVLLLKFRLLSCRQGLPLCARKFRDFRNTTWALLLKLLPMS